MIAARGRQSLKLQIRGKEHKAALWSWAVGGHRADISSEGASGQSHGGRVSGQGPLPLSNSRKTEGTGTPVSANNPRAGKGLTACCCLDFPSDLKPLSPSARRETNICSTCTCFFLWELQVGPQGFHQAERGPAQPGSPRAPSPASGLPPPAAAAAALSSKVLLHLARIRGSAPGAQASWEPVGL